MAKQSGSIRRQYPKTLASLGVAASSFCTAVMLAELLTLPLRFAEILGFALAVFVSVLSLRHWLKLTNLKASDEFAWVSKRLPSRLVKFDKSGQALLFADLPNTQERSGHPDPIPRERIRHNSTQSEASTDWEPTLFDELNAAHEPPKPPLLLPNNKYSRWLWESAPLALPGAICALLEQSYMTDRSRAARLGWLDIIKTLAARRDEDMTLEERIGAATLDLDLDSDSRVDVLAKGKYPQAEKFLQSLDLKLLYRLG